MKTCLDFLRSFVTEVFATISLSDVHTWSDVPLIGPAEGHIRERRRNDDGRTWIDLKSTMLVHPDAPLMVFHLGDDRALIAFIHNSYDLGRPYFDKVARNKLWCSISKDEEHTWSEPRFVFAGAASGKYIHSCSYIDMLVDGSRIHIFLGQNGRQLLYLHFDKSKFTQISDESQSGRLTESPGEDD